MLAAVRKTGGALSLAAALTLSIAVACGTPEPTPIPAATPEPQAAAARPASLTAPAEPGQVREVTVGPQRVDCVGAFPQLCLVVDDELFYDEIDGFEHEAGYEYRLRIEQYDRWPGQSEIPQDAGRYGYRLLEVLEKKSADR